MGRRRAAGEGSGAPFSAGRERAGCPAQTCRLPIAPSSGRTHGLTCRALEFRVPNFAWRIWDALPRSSPPPPLPLAHPMGEGNRWLEHPFIAPHLHPVLPQPDGNSTPHPNPLPVRGGEGGSAHHRLVLAAVAQKHIVMEGVDHVPGFVGQSFRTPFGGGRPLLVNRTQVQTLGLLVAFSLIHTPVRREKIPRNRVSGRESRNRRPLVG